MSSPICNMPFLGRAAGSFFLKRCVGQRCAFGFQLRYRKNERHLAPVSSHTKYTSTSVYIFQNKTYVRVIRLMFVFYFEDKATQCSGFLCHAWRSHPTRSQQHQVQQAMMMGTEDHRPAHKQPILGTAWLASEALVRHAGWQLCRKVANGQVTGRGGKIKHCD